MLPNPDVLVAHPAGRMMIAASSRSERRPQIVQRISSPTILKYMAKRLSFLTTDNV